MKVEFLKPDRADDLESFVAAHEHGCIEQTWVWGELQTVIDGRDAFFVLGVMDGEKLMGSMLLILQHMGHGKHWLWCPGGPLLPRGKGAEEEAWKLLKRACRDLAKKEKAIFMRIEPYYPKGSFHFGGKVSKESYLPRHTLLVDLRPDEKEILAQMKQKGRYNIKQAEKAGVALMHSKGQELAEFYEILKETAERDGFQLHDRKFYDMFLDLLEDRGRFYVAKLEGGLLAGIFVSHFGGRATYYFGASRGEHREKMAPYALQWFAMQDAKLRGHEKYDFLGIAPEGDEKHPLAGVTQFKTRFGGERVEYESARVFVYRPVWWWLYRVAKTFV